MQNKRENSSNVTQNLTNFFLYFSLFLCRSHQSPEPENTQFYTAWTACKDMVPTLAAAPYSAVKWTFTAFCRTHQKQEETQLLQWMLLQFNHKKKTSNLSILKRYNNG